MKRFIFLIITINLSFILLVSCGVNIFSIFNPTTVQDVNNVDSLIGIGDNYIYNLDYSNAFEAYSKALKIAPKNARAIEGACTAYLFMRVPVTNFVSSLISQTYLTAFPLNTLYDVSKYLGNNLYTIVNNQSDNQILSNDVNTDLNFYIFNTLYSLLGFVDTDDNMDIEGDVNDLIMIDATFVPTMSPILTNLLDQTTNTTVFNPFAMIKLITYVSQIKTKYTFMTNNLLRSDQSMAMIQNSIVTPSLKTELGQISGQMGQIVTSMDQQISILDTTNTNMINPFALTNIFNITNMVTNSVELITNSVTNESAFTNFISQGGYSSNDYTAFTNDMNNAGVTNMNDLTNLMPNITNINTLLSNYFGL